MNAAGSQGSGNSPHLSAMRRAQARAKLIPPANQTVPPPPRTTRQAAVAQLQTVPTVARYPAMRVQAGMSPSGG